MGKINKNDKDKQKESLIKAQDLKIIKALAGNDGKLREKVLKNLKKWLEQRSSKIPFTKEDFLRFWKGLFTTMWMSDKPLVQEECAEKIAGIIHFSSNPQIALLFFRSGLIVLTKEWFGIDQLRLDKFLMLVRRLLRQALEVLKEHKWNQALVVEFGNILFETVLKTESSTYLGLTLHITEIYLEELAKVSNGEIEKHLVAEFIKPFVKQLAKLTDDRQISHMKKFMFHHLLNQSDEGIEYQVKFEAWKERGFPGGNIDALERIEADDENISDVEDKEESYKFLDPRAGHVDVVLPQLKFDPQEISRLLLDHKFSEGSTTKARKAIGKIASEFEELSKEEFPLGMKEIRVPDDPSYSTNLRKSVNRLVKFEKKLLSNSNKNRKHKLKRKIHEIEVNEDENEVEVSEDKLQKFIRKSEGNLMNGNVPKKRKLMAKKEKNVKILKNKPNLRTNKKSVTTSNTSTKWSFEESFQRNSGTWFVEKLDSDESFGDEELVLNDNSPSKKRSLQIEVKNEHDKSKKSLSNDRSLRKKRLSNGETSPKHISSNSRQVKLNQNNTNHSTTKLKNEALFPQTEWDLPSKEGEVEIFVPSNKYKEKMKKLAKKADKTVEQLINEAVNGSSNRYSLNIAEEFANNKKKRLSLDSNIVRNPFAGVNTPKSEKKVKIDLKSNKEQDIHEHIAQLRNSPAIPYDAYKKPTKPLLKPAAVASPINPFYRRKLKLL